MSRFRGANFEHGYISAVRSHSYLPTGHRPLHEKEDLPMNTHRKAINSILASLTTETGEVRDFKELDISEVRAHTASIRNAGGSAAELSNSHIWKRTKKTMMTLRKQSKQALNTQDRIMVRLEDPTFVLLATKGATNDGSVLVPIVKKNRQKLDAKEAAIYRLEANLWKLVEGRVPPAIKKARKETSLF